MKKIYISAKFRSEVYPSRFLALFFVVLPSSLYALSIWSERWSLREGLGFYANNLAIPVKCISLWSCCFSINHSIIIWFGLVLIHMLILNQPIPPQCVIIRLAKSCTLLLVRQWFLCGNLKTDVGNLKKLTWNINSVSETEVLLLEH